MLILGQTMTGTHGTTGKGGGQAFGKVEMAVKEDRIDACGKFAASIINNQLIKSICQVNYGDTEECPEIRFLEDEEGDLQAAQRDKILIDANLPIGVDFMRKKYGIPEPAEGEETLEAPQPKPFGGGGDAQPKPSTETEMQQAPAADQLQDEKEPAEAKLKRVLEIQDDAIFAGELSKLASELSEEVANV
jgi:phage gp29-like protein